MNLVANVLMTASRSVAATVLAAACLVGLPRAAQAHCDTLNGPVVAAARAALGANDIQPVLKWIRQEDEAEARRVFQQTMTVRALSAAARDLADRYFFETVVRLHRAGEGEPFTGLKDAVADDLLEAADRALEDGSDAALVRLVADRAAAGVRERFAQARERRTRAEVSAVDGRRYVTAYVELMHYLEQLGDGEER